MIAGAMIAGLGGAVLSGGMALAAGLPVLAALGCYSAGGSATLLLSLAVGARRTPA